jgi:hypothetical protein
MTQAGGPAAIKDFLYQVSHHIGWLADITLTGALDGQEIEDACLVLEPRTGGDAPAEAAGSGRPQRHGAIRRGPAQRAPKRVRSVRHSLGFCR